MVELVDRSENAQTEDESVSPAEVLSGVVLGLGLSVGPFLAGWGGVMECGLPFAAVVGTVAPPEDADTRWYTSRALVFVGVVAFFVVGLVDPLRGDTDFLAAVTAILVGAALSQSADD